MPNIRYYNQTAPFWDFIASFENQGLDTVNHLFGNGGESSNQRGGPWGWPRGPMPHHGGPPHRGGPHHHHGPPGHHPHGPPHDHKGPPPPEGEGPPPPDYENGSPDTMMGDGYANEKAGPSNTRDENRQTDNEQCNSGDEAHRRCRRGRHGKSCARGSGGRRGRHGHGGGHGGPGGFGSGVPPFLPFMAGPGGPAGWANRWAEFLGGDYANNNQNNTITNAGTDRAAADKSGAQDAFFKPDADVFDGESSYVIHLSLPGAKKEDVSVSWEAEKSELCVAGVISRPGDEAFLKTLALDERSVGAFERRVRLGSRANPATVDVEGMTAKLEDGVLVVEVPKLEGGFVEVRKVDIE